MPVYTESVVLQDAQIYIYEKLIGDLRCKVGSRRNVMVNSVDIRVIEGW